MIKAALLCGTTLALTCAGQVMAQEATANQPAAQAQEAESSGVTEIIVTAQFRSENLQTTPIAITAVNAEMLEARGIANVSQIAQSAPSVTLQPTQATYGKSTAAFIRGIGQSDFIPALDPGVGIYIDDVYFATVFGSAFDLIDADRVEVLRGPQGTLAGRNSIGGAIKLFSRKPDGDGKGYLEASYGSFERVSVKGAADFTLVPDKLFARISGVAKQGGGYVDRLDYGCLNPTSGTPSAGGQAPGCKLGNTGGDNLAGARLYLRALPTENLEISLIADVTKDSSQPSPETLIFAAPSAFFPGVDLSPYVPTNPYVTYSTFSGVVNPAAGTPLSVEPVSRSNNWGVAGIVDLKLSDNLSIKSISGYREVDGLFSIDEHTPETILLYNIGLKSKQFTQELRLSGNVGEFADFTIGGYYFKNDIENPGRAFSFGTFDQLQNDKTNSESKAAFGHLEISATEQIKVIGGIRYTDDKKTYSFNRSQAQGVPYGLFGLFGVLEGLDGTQGTFKGDRLDWRVGVNFQATSDVMVYAQASSGYKSGGINPRPFYSTQVVPFAPETVISYEAGLKTQLFDRAVRFNAAAFYSDYKNIQLTLNSCPTLVPPGQVPLCNLVTNAGSAHIKGFEAEAEIHPVQGFMIDSSLSYVDFDYTEKSTLGAIGNQPPLTPKWKFAAGAQYQAELGSAGSITPRLDYTYQSSVFFDVANAPQARQDGYGLFNTRLTWRSVDKDVSVSLAVTNLTDKLYYLNKSASFLSSFGMVTGIPGRPREWSISVQRKF